MMMRRQREGERRDQMTRDRMKEQANRRRM